MNSNRLMKTAFSLALASGLFLAAHLPTFAQDYLYARDGWQDNRRERRQERDGYLDGVNQGRADARSRFGFDPNHSKYFRDGNAEYREGFQRGYREGFRQYENAWRW